MDDPLVLLQRRRIWGVPSDAVAQWVAACQREQAALHTQLATLEMRLTQISMERDAASATIAALKDDLARLEAEKAEWKGRPETIRAEAIQFVVDAYAEAQQARMHIAQEIAAEKAAAHEAIETERTAMQKEIAAIRQDLDAERRRHEAAVAALQQQQAETIASLDAIGRTLLTQFGHVNAIASAATVPPREQAAEVSTDAIADHVPDAVRAVAPEPPLPMDALPTQPDAHPSAARVGTPLDIPPDEGTAHTRRSAPPEDTMLARALDELEAILRGNRKAGSEN